MKIETENLKNNLKERIENLSEERLKDVFNYLEFLEKETASSDVLSFAGSWSDMDSDTFDGLTVDLKERRKTHRKKFRL